MAAKIEFSYGAGQTVNLLALCLQWFESTPTQASYRGILQPLRTCAFWATQRRCELDEALALVAQAAVLPEIDTNAFKEAVEAIDKKERTSSLNALLASQLRNPAFNAFIASVWVSRVGSLCSWKLLRQFNEIPQEGNAHAAFLEQWLLRSSNSRYCLQAARTIREHCNGYAEKHVQVWAY